MNQNRPDTVQSKYERDQERERRARKGERAGESERDSIDKQ